MGINKRQLEDKAFELAGIESYPSDATRSYSDYVYGRATITTSKGTFPLKGVKVRCHRFLDIETTYTSDTGHYYIQHMFNGDVNYQIKYENDSRQYRLCDEWSFIQFGTASYSFGKHSTRFNIEISSTSYTDAWDDALVYNTTSQYYDYCDSTGIQTPPDDLIIGLRGENKDWGSAPMIHHLSTGAVNLIPGATSYLPDLYITVESNSISLFSSFVKSYRSIVHELSHASHFAQVGEDFWGRYINYIVVYGSYGDGTANTIGMHICDLGESWAYSHANYITNLKVGTGVISFNPHCS